MPSHFTKHCLGVTQKQQQQLKPETSITPTLMGAIAITIKTVSWLVLVLGFYGSLRTAQPTTLIPLYISPFSPPSSLYTPTRRIG